MIPGLNDDLDSKAPLVSPDFSGNAVFLDASFNGNVRGITKAMIPGLNDDLDSKAPLVSPLFSGAAVFADASFNGTTSIKTLSVNNLSTTSNITLSSTGSFPTSEQLGYTYVSIVNPSASVIPFVAPNTASTASAPINLFTLTNLSAGTYLINAYFTISMTSSSTLTFSLGVNTVSAMLPTSYVWKPSVYFQSGASNANTSQICYTTVYKKDTSSSQSIYVVASISNTTTSGSSFINGSSFKPALSWYTYTRIA